MFYTIRTLLHRVCVPHVLLGISVISLSGCTSRRLRAPHQPVRTVSVSERPQTRVYVIRVDGVECDICDRHARTALEAVPGVMQVSLYERDDELEYALYHITIASMESEEHLCEALQAAVDPHEFVITRL